MTVHGHEQDGVPPVRSTHASYVAELDHFLSDVNGEKLQWSVRQKLRIHSWKQHHVRFSPTPDAPPDFDSAPRLSAPRNDRDCPPCRCGSWHPTTTSEKLFAIPLYTGCQPTMIWWGRLLFLFFMFNSPKNQSDGFFRLAVRFFCAGLGFMVFSAFLVEAVRSCGASSASRGKRIIVSV